MHLSPDVLRPLSAAERLQLRARMNDLADRAALRYRDAVRPIYAATEKGEPSQMGSAILLEVRGVKLLLTAAHIIDWNANMTATLYVGAGNHFVQIDAEFCLTRAPGGDRDKDQYDFAVALLSDVMIAQLGSGYITEGDIATQVQPGNLYTALGFPNSKNRWFNRKTGKMVAKAFTYSSTWRFNQRIARRLAGSGAGDHHVFLGYSKHSRSEEGIKVSSTEPRGLSGGAIIDAGRPTDLRVFRAQVLPIPRLIGMTIERWKEEQVLVGTRLAGILPVIYQCIANPPVVRPAPT